MKGRILETWSSAPGRIANQWVELVFPEPVTIRTVRLYNVRFTDGSTLQVNDATVRLGLSGSSGWLASAAAQALSASGTDVSFANVKADIVRVEIGSVSGR